MTRIFHPLLAVLTATVVFALVVVFALPTGSTEARWRDQDTKPIPAIAMGGIDLGLTRGGPGTNTEAYIDNHSGFGVALRPSKVRVAALPSSPTTTAEAADFFSLFKGTTIKFLNQAVGCQTASPSAARWQVPQKPLAIGTEYAVSPIGGETSIPLAKGTVGHELCMIVQPGLNDRDRYSLFAGREFQVSTTIAATSPGNSSWTRDYVWPLTNRVDVPPAVPRFVNTNGAQTIPCKSVPLENRVTVQWAWPDASAEWNTSRTGIDRWDILIRSSGTPTWRLLKNHDPGLQYQSDNVIHRNDLNDVGATGTGRYDVLLRGYPFASNSSKYVDSSHIWTIDRNNRDIVCGPLRPNPASGYNGFDQP